MRSDVVMNTSLRLCAVFAQNTDVIRPLVISILDVSLLLSLPKSTGDHSKTDFS